MSDSTGLPPAHSADSEKNLDENRSQVTDRLKRSPYLSLRTIKCALVYGVLVLSGEVPTFEVKEIAQSVARSAWAGEIVNQLEVRFREPAPRGSSSRTQ